VLGPFFFVQCYNAKGAKNNILQIILSRQKGKKKE